MAQLGNTTITGTLAASGAVTFASTLGVTGAVTFGSSLAVTGNQTVGGTLVVTGAITAPSLTLTAAATLSGQAMRKGEVDAAISGLSSVFQPLDSDLSAIAALSTSSFGRGLLALANQAALRTAAGVVPGTDVQAYDATLAGLAGKTVSGSGNIVLQSYVDSVAAGLQTKDRVRVATTANGTLSTAFANGQTVDGVMVGTGDRILLKNQAAPAENGVYVVADSGAPVRATDFNAWPEIPGALVAVEEGTANHDTLWLSTADLGGTLETTGITFSNPFALALLSTNNLSDVANAVTALSNLGGASSARTISPGGLATGGGDLTADRTITVPGASQAEAEAGTDNTKVMTPLTVRQGVAVLLGFKVKTSAYTALSFDKISGDSSGGSFTITLPASPAVGDPVRIQDGTGSAATHHITVGRNGKSIGGLAEDLTISTDNADAEFTYVGGSMGWQVTRLQ